MQFTTNYNLKKPEGTDNYDKANDNGNMDIIDTALHSHDTSITAANSHIADKNNPHSVTAAQAGAVAKDGSIPMTGPLVLSGNPSNPLHAVPEQYVDSFIKDSPAPTSVSLSNGVQIINATKSGMLRNFKVIGRTLVNLTGRAGNGQSLSPFSFTSSSGALDTSNYSIGTQSVKITLSATSGNASITLTNLVVGQTYTLAADVKDGNASSIFVSVSGIANGNSVAATSAFQVSYMTFTATATSHTIAVVVTGASGQYAYFDALRLYAVTSSEKANIDGMTVANAQTYIGTKYPYVDDTKHLSGFYAIRYGENLLPEFGQWTDNVDSNGSWTTTEPYSATLTTLSGAALAGEQKYIVVPTVPNTQYTLSVGLSTNAGYAINDGVSGSALAGWNSNASTTFTTGAATTSVKVYFGNNVAGAGTFTFTGPRLNIGSTDKGFKPRNDDMMVFPVSLASNYDGSVYDEIYHRDGRYWRMNRFQNMVLDGSLTWNYNTTGTGFKSVYASMSANGLVNTGTVVKYDGKILPILNYGSAVTTSDQQAFGGSSNSNNIVISVSSADSGWGDSYTPTNQEVQAYFYGWKMYLGGQGDITQPFNGTGTKAWTPLDGISGSTGAIYVSSVPTSPPNGGYTKTKTITPYKLTYQLATPTWDDLTEIMEGEINLLEGSNQIEVGVGMILREKATPYTYNNTTWYINGGGSASAFTKYRNAKYAGVYKNGRMDSWSLHIDSSNGLYDLNTTTFDPTATYEVTYQTLDQYLLTPSAVTTITGEYDTNIKTVQDRTSQTLADALQRLSVAEMLAARVYRKPDMSTQNMNYYVDGTNGSDSGDGSAAKPFKTIGKAVSILPQVVNHTITINLASGTYSETVNINGFVGNGSITILGAGAANTSVQRIFVSYCMTGIVIDSLTGTLTGGWPFEFTRSTGVTIQNCTVSAADTNYEGMRTAYGKYVAQQCTFSNRKSPALADFNSDLQFSNNSGSGNSYLLSVGIGGKIAPYGTQPTATGGYLTTGGVINPWGDNNSAVNKAANGYQKLPSGFIIQWGMSNVASGATITYPIAFPSVVASVTATTNSSSVYAVSVNNLTSSSFTALHGNGTNATWVCWIAIGY